MDRPQSAQPPHLATADQTLLATLWQISILFTVDNDVETFSSDVSDLSFFGLRHLMKSGHFLPLFATLLLNFGIFLPGFSIISKN